MGLWILKSYSASNTEYWKARNRSRFAYFKEAFPQNLRHFTTAIFGLGLKLDPQLQPPIRFAELTILLIQWGVLLSVALLLKAHGQPELFLGLIFFWVSPLWLYTLEPFLYPDMVFEWRAYLTVAGVGLMVAALPLYIGWALVLIWALQSWRRSFAFRTKLAYARQAFKENPLSKRQEGNIKKLEDADMAKEIARLLSEGKPIPPELLAQHYPTSEFYPVPTPERPR